MVTGGGDSGKVLIGDGGRSGTGVDGVQRPKTLSDIIHKGSGYRLQQHSGSSQQHPIGTGSTTAPAAGSHNGLYCSVCGPRDTSVSQCSTCSTVIGAPANSRTHTIQDHQRWPPSSNIQNGNYGLAPVQNYEQQNYECLRGQTQQHSTAAAPCMLLSNQQYAESRAPLQRRVPCSCCYHTPHFADGTTGGGGSGAPQYYPQVHYAVPPPHGNFYYPHQQHTGQQQQQPPVAHHRGLTGATAVPP
eukprot:Lankesteria_metandrocarpae@DN2205_c0_g1_i1.p1